MHSRSSKGEQLPGIPPIPAAGSGFDSRREFERSEL